MLFFVPSKFRPFLKQTQQPKPGAISGLSTLVTPNQIQNDGTEFVQLVTSDVAHYLKEAESNRVLVFPPVDSFYRLLIHKTVEEFPTLCSFSIGEEDERRTVVCLQQTILQASQLKQYGEVTDSVEQVYRRVAMSQDQWGHDGYKKEAQASTRPLSGRRSRGRGRKESDRRYQHDDRLANTEPVPGHDHGRDMRRPNSGHRYSDTPAPQTKTRDTTGLRARRPDAQVYVPRGRRTVVQEKNVQETVVGRPDRENDQASIRAKNMEKTEIRGQRSEKEMCRRTAECQEVEVGRDSSEISFDSRGRASRVSPVMVSLEDNELVPKKTWRGSHESSQTRPDITSRALDEENKKKHKKRKKRDSSHSKDRKIRDKSTEDREGKQKHKSKHKEQWANLSTQDKLSEPNEILVANAGCKEEKGNPKNSVINCVKSQAQSEGQFDDMMEYCYTVDDDEIEEPRNLTSSSSIIIHSQEDLSTVGLERKEAQFSGVVNSINTPDIHVDINEVLKPSEQFLPYENDMKYVDGDSALDNGDQAYSTPQESITGDIQGRSVYDNESNAHIKVSKNDQELVSSNNSGTEQSDTLIMKECSTNFAETILGKLSDQDSEMSEPYSVTSDNKGLSNSGISENNEEANIKNPVAETKYAISLNKDTEEAIDMEKSDKPNSDICTNDTAQVNMVGEEEEEKQVVTPDDSDICILTKKEDVEVEGVTPEPCPDIADQDNSKIEPAFNELCQNNEERNQEEENEDLSGAHVPDHSCKENTSEMEITNPFMGNSQEDASTPAEHKEHDQSNDDGPITRPRPDTIIGAELPQEVFEPKVDNIHSHSDPAVGNDVSKEPEEDSWDQLFDDEGEALDPKLMEELTMAVGKVSVQKTQFDYYNFQPKEPDMNYEEYNHLIEIYDFPSEFITRDLIMAFSEFMNKGFDIKWVDDTHAIGVFESSIGANSALKTGHPLLKIRPISEASKATKLKAKKCTEFLQPYKQRPETNAAVARSLVTGALGLRSAVPREKQIEERKKLRAAREKKKDAQRLKKDAWEGVIGKCAMDEEG